MPRGIPRRTRPEGRTYPKPASKPPERREDRAYPRPVWPHPSPVKPTSDRRKIGGPIDPRYPRREK